MAVIKNEDFDIMCKVEDLLLRKIKETNGKKCKHNGEEYYYFDENDKEYNLWLDYWNMVERYAEERDNAKEKAKKFNKDHKEYHQLNVKRYYAKKVGNKEQEKKYADLIEDYKKKKKMEMI